MARDRTPTLKRCRALGLSPAVIGSAKAPSKRTGKSSGRPKKLSEYGKQLREKQKLKFIYGMLEAPFHNLYNRAVKNQGVTGEVLLSLLERRLDNVVFRLGFARTRPEARQFVTHGHILVDGKKLDIPSYEVSQGQVIEICEKARKTEHVKEVLEVTSAMGMPAWLERDSERFKGSVTKLPTREDIDYEINERMIVELYSK